MESNAPLSSIYENSILNRDVSIPIENIGKNINEIIELTLNEIIIGGKCIAEGFVKKDSIELISYSGGIVNANYVTFSVIFKCKIFYPVDGMILKTKVTSISIGGISSISAAEQQSSPFIVYIYKEHDVENFNKIQMNDIINIRVIGQQFSLNDTEITIIGEYMDTVSD